MVAHSVRFKEIKSTKIDVSHTNYNVFSDKSPVSSQLGLPFQIQIQIRYVGLEIQFSIWRMCHRQFPKRPTNEFFLRHFTTKNRWYQIFKKKKKTKLYEAIVIFGMVSVSSYGNPALARDLMWTNVLLCGVFF